ncbi:transketolase-like TK C-terminal-containing protein [Alkalispirillum mobile]
MPWQALLGDRGRVIGMETFGESAPGPALYEHFGFTVEAVLEAARAV